MTNVEMLIDTHFNQLNIKEYKLKKLDNTAKFNLQETHGEKTPNNYAPTQYFNNGINKHTVPT